MQVLRRGLSSDLIAHSDNEPGVIDESLDHLLDLATNVLLVPPDECLHSVDIAVHGCSSVKLSRDLNRAVKSVNVAAGRTLKRTHTINTHFHEVPNSIHALAVEMNMQQTSVPVHFISNRFDKRLIPLPPMPCSRPRCP